MSVADVREKIQRILADALGSVSVDRDGDFRVQFGSSVVFVSVHPLNDDATIVNCWSSLLDQFTLTPEVYKWVAVDGQKFNFGHARMIELESGLGRIIFEHTLLGDFLDPEELKWAVFALGHSADNLDDTLQGRFGGKKFIEG